MAEPEQERSLDDSDEGWGDAPVDLDPSEPSGSDRRLMEDRPPHHDRP